MTAIVRDGDHVFVISGDDDGAELLTAGVCLMVKN